MKLAACWILGWLSVLGTEAAGTRALTEAEVQRVEQAIPALPPGLSEAEVMRRLGLDPIRQVATATAVGGKAPDFTTTYTLGAAGQLSVTLRGEPVVRVAFSRRAGAAPTAEWPDRATRPASSSVRVVADPPPVPRPARPAVAAPAEVGAAATEVDRRRELAMKDLRLVATRLHSHLGVTLLASLFTAVILKLAIRVTAGVSVGLVRCYLLSVAIMMLVALLNATLLGAWMFAPLDGLPWLAVAVGLGLLVSIGAPAGVLSRLPDEQTGLPIGWWRGLLTFLTYAAFLSAIIYVFVSCVRYVFSP